MNYEDLLDDIIETSNKLSIFTGCIDIIKDGDYFIAVPESIEYPCQILGKYYSEEIVKEAFVNYEFSCDISSGSPEGCYEYEAVLRYEEPDYFEGRMVSKDYLNVEYIRLKLNHTFIQREREQKLNELEKDLFDNTFIF